jgi:hypothetical protein
MPQQRQHHFTASSDTAVVNYPLALLTGACARATATST